MGGASGRFSCASIAVFGGRVAADVSARSSTPPVRLRMLVGKPGLDGQHGAEQMAVATRDFGIQVGYERIRPTPARIANPALEEGVPIVGL